MMMMIVVDDDDDDGGGGDDDNMMIMVVSMITVPAYSAVLHVTVQTARNSFKCRFTVLLTILVIVFFKL